MQSVVIGADQCGLGSALRNTDVRVRYCSVREALRRPGTLTGVDLVVLTWWPGTIPTLEEQVFTAGTGALYTLLTPTAAAVGPYLAWSVTPCPRCHAREAQHHSGQVDIRLPRWVAAWLAVEFDALARLGVTDLVGRSYCWELERPGLQELTWARQPNCQRTGCITAVLR